MGRMSSTSSIYSDCDCVGAMMEPGVVTGCGIGDGSWSGVEDGEDTGCSVAAFSTKDFDSFHCCTSVVSVRF